MKLTFKPTGKEHAQAILQWRYDEPYSFYNPKPDDLPALLAPKNAYYAVTAKPFGSRPVV